MRNNDFLNKSIELSEDKIHVFLLNLHVQDSEELYQFLSTDEKERADRLKIELKKKQFVISRGALRKIISNSIDKLHDEIVFYYGEHNKPYIKDKINNKVIEFNISHSYEYILIALTLENKVGVDVEKIDQQIDFDSLSKRFFSSREVKYINSTDNKLDAFYHIWTRKEAFIKAVGEGVAYGLDKFSVSSDNELTSLIEMKEENINREKWSSKELMELENYKTALSTNNTDAELIFYP